MTHQKLEKTPEIVEFINLLGQVGSSPLRTTFFARARLSRPMLQRAGTQCSGSSNQGVVAGDGVGEGTGPVVAPAGLCDGALGMSPFNPLAGFIR